MNILLRLSKLVRISTLLSVLSLILLLISSNVAKSSDYPDHVDNKTELTITIEPIPKMLPLVDKQALNSEVFTNLWTYK